MNTSIETVPLRFIRATPQRGAQVTHGTDTIQMAWPAAADCSVRLTPNPEGDVILADQHHARLTLHVHLRADGPVTLRARLRGTGWLASHTELWSDHTLSDGENRIDLDTRALRICHQRGPADYLLLEWRDQPAGELRLAGMAVEAQSGAEYFAPRVDRFGQYRHGDWPGKVHDEAELAADAQAPLPAPMAGRDRFGGWAEGPRHEATGFFRTEQADDAWWLITPDGTRFRSFGPCCVSAGTLRCRTEDRQELFEWLPPREGLMLDAWQGARPGKRSEVEMYPLDSFGGDPNSSVVNLYMANLLRKWGERWHERWSEAAVARLKHWGMNTLACWSDLHLAETGCMPYCFSAERVCEHDFGDLAAGADAGLFPLKHLPDVFHPAFESRARGWFEELARFRDDPWLLGYFFKNEEPWLAWHSPFALPLHWQSRRKFIDELRDHYGTIQKLNAAWNTGFVGFEPLAQRQMAANPPGLSEEGERMCDDFIRRFVSRYYEVARREMRQADPNHLFLGCRYLALPPRPCILEGAAPHMDVVSINWYLWHKQQPEDAADFLGRWHEMCGGKPLAITEYSFTATDARMLACHLSHFTQAERAATAERFTKSCLALPFLVGMHWFQYVDQPLLGRALGDGERANFGLVDGCDRIHPEMAEVTRRCGGVLYPRP